MRNFERRERKSRIRRHVFSGTVHFDPDAAALCGSVGVADYRRALDGERQHIAFITTVRPSPQLSPQDRPVLRFEFISTLRTSFAYITMRRFGTVGLVAWNVVLPYDSSDALINVLVCGRMTVQKRCPCKIYLYSANSSERTPS